MNAQDLIRDFGSCSGLSSFALDERGLARLKLDGDMIIDFEHDTAQNVLHIYSTIAQAPHTGGEAQLRLLMEANLFLDRSGGCTCALDNLTGEFIACLRLDPELYDGKALVTWLERLADTVERLRQDLAALEHGENAEEAGNENEFDPGRPFA
ncbi:MAG: type III secretion system chaperone [Janthinobacterium lividum]